MDLHTPKREGTMTTATTRKVSEAAIVQRIRRRMAQTSERLSSCRPGTRWHNDLGDWYAVDDHNNVTARHIDLEEFAKELGVLAENERAE
jgi:hypothetical protein